MPKGDIIIIMGDWNAKIGEAGAPGIARKHGLVIQNWPGERMLDLCQENDLIISNT